MAIAKKCDVCGDYYELYNVDRNASEPNGFMMLNIDSKQQYWSHKAVDCCPKCMESILQHIEYLKNKPKLKTGV